MSSTPVSRRCLLATIFGSKLESRSRGTLMSAGPASVITVLARHWRGTRCENYRRYRPPVVPGIAEVIIQLALQLALDDHFRQLAGQAALAGQLQAAAAGPLGELPQQLLTAADSSTSSWPRSTVTSVIWCLLRFWSYTVEITVPEKLHCPISSYEIGARESGVGLDGLDAFNKQVSRDEEVHALCLNSTTLRRNGDVCRWCADRVEMPCKAQLHS